VTTTTTPIPTAPPGLSWSALVQGNPSLASWLRSARQAALNGMSHWLRWANTSTQLKSDVSAAVGHGATVETWRQALDLARQKIAEAYQEGQAAREQAEEREKAAERKTRPPAPSTIKTPNTSRRPKWAWRKP
jgi:hypothetical protein